MSIKKIQIQILIHPCCDSTKYTYMYMYMYTCVYVRTYEYICVPCVCATNELSVLHHFEGSESFGQFLFHNVDVEFAVSEVPPIHHGLQHS